MGSKVRLAAMREEDYGGSLLRYFEDSEDAQRQIGFVLPPSAEDLKSLFPIGAAYKIVSSAATKSDVCGAIRLMSRSGKTAPKINIRLAVNDPALIREIYPLVQNFAKTETKSIIEAYHLHGYEKEKIDSLLDLGFIKGASTLKTDCLDGQYFDSHYLYKDLETEYQISPKRKYAEQEDLYPLVPLEKQKKPLRLSFRMAIPDDGADLAESMSHQNTFRTLGMGEYQGFMTKSESVSFIEQGKRSGLNHPIVCVDQERNKVIGISDIHIQLGHVSTHVGYIGIHVNAYYHGLGVGTLLLREIDVLAKRLHLQSLVLSYFETNEAGKKLYEKIGFEHRGEIPGWLASGYVKEIYMQKMLSC